MSPRPIHVGAVPMVPAGKLDDSESNTIPRRWRSRERMMPSIQHEVRIELVLVTRSMHVSQETEYEIVERRADGTNKTFDVPQLWAFARIR